MKKRVFALTLILLLAFALSAFGADKKSANPYVDKIMVERLKSMENADYPNDNIVSKQATGPIVPKPLGGMPLDPRIAGFTYYDYQHNDCMRRMIANGTDASNKRHVTWMYLDDIFGGNRFVNYNSYIDTPPYWPWDGGMTVTPAANRGGYCGLDLLPDQKEVLCYHRTQPDPGNFWGTAISIETGNPGAGTFWSYDIPDSVSGAKLKGLWPTVACAKSAVSGKNYIHITSAEGQTAGTADKSMYYVRCYRNSVSGMLICQSPGWTDSLVHDTTTLAPNRLCYQYARCRLGTGIIATSPVSGKVAIVYFKNYSTTQTQNELMYMESSTNGSDWIANPATMTATQLTSYQTADVDRAYDDLAAIYDYNDHLHIVWTTFKSTNSNDVTLWHWTASQGIRKAGSATAGSTTNPGRWNLLIAKFNLGICHPTTDSTILYLTYTKFQDGDTSAGGFANGDICAKASLNFGLTWGPETTLVHTNSNNCEAGACKSEHWSSLAERVDNYLHISYIHDLDAGGWAGGGEGYEGTAQWDSVIYLKFPRFSIPQVASMTYSPATLINPPEWAVNGGNRPDSIKFDNIGTCSLYVKLSGPAYLTATPSQFNIVEAGPTQKVNLTFTAPHPDTFLVDSLKIVSNNRRLGGGPVYSDTQWVKFHFVVADTFYYAEFDSCLRGSKLMVSNVGNLGHQEPGYMMNFNNHGYLFDYSPAFATDAGGLGKLSFTWVHKNNNYLAEDHLKSKDYPGLKTKAWHDYAAPSFIDEEPSRPWWSGWTKYSRIAQFDWDNLHVVLVKNWWKWNRPPKWWPDFTITTPAGGYFGFAGDWDVPDSAASKDLGAFDSTTNLIVYQYSDSTGFFNHYGGFGFLSAAVIHGTDTTKYTKPYSVHILTNKTQLYPDEGYNDDSLFKYMSQAGWSKEWSGTKPDSSQDLNIVVTAVKKLDPDTSTIITEEHFLLASNYGLANFTYMANLMRKLKPGDCNTDGNVTASDVVFLINYLFIGGPEPPLAFCDCNGDCKVNASDVVCMINYLFIGGPKPATPCWDRLPWEPFP
jgi:hypothetical protein